MENRATKQALKGNRTTLRETVNPSSVGSTIYTVRENTSKSLRPGLTSLAKIRSKIVLEPSVHVINRSTLATSVGTQSRPI